MQAVFCYSDIHDMNFFITEFLKSNINYI